MKRMDMTTIVVVVAKVPMEEQAEALAGVLIVSVATAAGGIIVPRGKGASHRALIADHKPPLRHPGLPRSPL